MELESDKTLFYNLCRLCLDERGTYSIHEHLQLPLDIFQCTGVKVSISDNLPGKVCTKCCNIIKISIEFRELVTRNDTHLKALFGEIKDENIDEDVFNIDSNGVIKTNLSNDKQNDNFLTQVELNKDNRDNHITEKQTCFVQPLKMLTVRKDLFPDSAPELPIKESICKEKVKIKKVKKKETKVIQYRCEDCCKNFETWKKLYLHARLHKKNISCRIDACEKKFATKGDMEKHVRTHTGEKPYQCDHCHKSFAQKGSLKSHIENVHNSKSSKDR